MRTDLTVRSATTDDVADVQSVAREAWHATYDDVLGAETVDELLAEGYTEDVLGRMVDLAEVGLFVAEDDGEVVGYASCGMTDTVGLGDLDVYAHPDYWGSGVGERLLERGFDHLGGVGVGVVRDEVLVENEVGTAFYQKHFEEVDRRRVDLGGETHQVAVFERSLDRPEG